MGRKSHLTEWMIVPSLLTVSPNERLGSLLCKTWTRLLRNWLEQQWALSWDSERTYCLQGLAHQQAYSGKNVGVLEKQMKVRRENWRKNQSRQEGKTCQDAFLVLRSHPSLRPSALKSVLRFCDTPLNSNLFFFLNWLELLILFLWFAAKAVLMKWVNILGKMAMTTGVCFSGREAGGMEG